MLSEFEKLDTFRTYFMLILHTCRLGTLRTHLVRQGVLLMRSREIFLLLEPATLLDGLRMHDFILLVQARLSHLFPPQLILQGSDVPKGGQSV